MQFYEEMLITLTWHLGWTTFLELSFTVYFGEIDSTKKNPNCVYREREKEREKERKNREKTKFFSIFFSKKIISRQKI